MRISNQIRWYVDEKIAAVNCVKLVAFFPLEIKMKSLWAIVFIVGYFACAKGSQHAGGLMNGDGSYIPGMVMLLNVDKCFRKAKERRKTNRLLFFSQALLWCGLILHGKLCVLLT